MDIQLRFGVKPSATVAGRSCKCNAATEQQKASQKSSLQTHQKFTASLTYCCRLNTQINSFSGAYMQSIRLNIGQQAPHRPLDEWLAKWTPKHGADIAQLVSDESIPPPLLVGTTTSQPGPFSGISGVASVAPGGPDRSLRSISFKRSSLLMSVWIIQSSSSCSSLSSASSSPSCIPWEKTPTTVFQCAFALLSSMQ